MCGIVGFFTSRPLTEPTQTLRRMNDTIAHRGPDADGEWLNASRSVGLGHRRLAIVDLTDEGRQPMHSASGRFTIVFNGEIYNFQRIRPELEKLGHRFRGHSDTEVMLAAFEQWGVAASLGRFVGMFAFAVWDSRLEELTLARDRVGKKPLYYSLQNGQLIFGSELKALRAFPGFNTSIDRQALTLFMRHLYIPAPQSIYEGTMKLDAACYARFGLRGRVVTQLERACYWDAAEVQQQKIAQKFDGSIEEAASQLEELLRDAVQLRMIADVPLGAFLSGGIDSSLIVALMQSLSNRPVRTFTIGFHEDQFNEAQYAKAVAQHLGTEHTETFLTPKETLAVIPKLPQMYDEPFADSSQIPTALVCAMARQHVTVALSGDGGDEGFGGYTRYAQALSICGKLSRVPPIVRSASRAIPHVPIETWELLAKLLRPVARGKLRADGFGYRVQRLADRVGCSTPQALYRHLMSYWTSPERLVIAGQEPSTVLGDAPAQASLDQFTDQMMLLDTLTYLPDDILVKVDRASMAVALEVRAPLLDHRVLEYAWRLPLAMKLQDGRGKLVLRRILSRYVPDQLFERPKTGFGVPIYRWLRGPLRDWAEGLLGARRLEQEGFFNPRPIRRVWESLLLGRDEWTYGGDLLWGVLMFQAWLDESKNASAAAACDIAVEPRPLAKAVG
jgi:asparagine synthase (glutamine-hydrolysing)